ncbi:MAG: beta-ketoacyl-[acyl-carrier-protein] synthase II [Nitrospirae bacterium]|nr:beta-ketoacyl-[acyl-carrier-protein] synthase II [Nitrospirota bacterium]
MARRVAVTGIGMITPLGTGTEKSWNGLLEGRSGIRTITQFDAAGYPCRIAGEVADFEIDRFIDLKEQKKMDRFIHFGVAAATMAVKDSGLQITEENAGRVGVIVGAQQGTTDAMIAGGAEAVITPLGIAGFTAMKALSTRNHEPERASRPFDRDRDGFVMGEGAGILVLEELESARKRGARIYAEIIGYGMTGDAYHITSPPPEGEGAARCMAAALKDASVNPEDVNYINAHGTSTRYGDELESSAIKKVFGGHAYKVTVSSTKSMTGHLLGAAGGVEAVISVLSIVNSIVPPTINLENPDPECDLDYVPNKARQMNVDVAMSNSFGFGGTNACIVFRKYTGN